MPSTFFRRIQFIPKLAENHIFLGFFLFHIHIYKQRHDNIYIHNVGLFSICLLYSQNWEFNSNTSFTVMITNLKKVSFQLLHRISLCFTINHIVNLAPSLVIITYSPKIVWHYPWTNYCTIPIKQHSIYNIANWKTIHFHPIITTDFVPNMNPFT